ncbi:hypothetical protein AAKU55_005347 [Oxalobacteraceae bacterium GrIS 1.11]
MTRSAPLLLDETQLARVLIEMDLVSRKAFVGGSVRFTLADRRNRNVKIALEGTDGLFTKQAKSYEALITLQRESAALDLLSLTEDDLSNHLPKKIAFNNGFGLLVTKLIADGRSLHDVLLHSGRIQARHARMAGAVLAGVHRRAIPANHDHGIRIPHTLELNRPHYTLLNSLSPANLKLLEAIQNDHALSSGLDRLRANWQPCAFIHGDAKLDNMVVARDSVSLVDWELATIGDPRWDVGTVFSSFLSNWVGSMPMAHGASHELMTREARLHIDKLQTSARWFWLAYASTSGLDPSGPFREEAMAYCGGRLMQTAYEYMQHASRLTANAIYMMQMAANILWNPSQGAEFLLGNP